MIMRIIIIIIIINSSNNYNNNDNNMNDKYNNATSRMLAASGFCLQAKDSDQKCTSKGI